jgi:hypothetical protein
MTQLMNIDDQRMYNSNLFGWIRWHWARLLFARRHIVLSSLSRKELVSPHLVFVFDMLAFEEIKEW